MTRCGSSSHKGWKFKFGKHHSNAILKTSWTLVEHVQEIRLRSLTGLLQRFKSRFFLPLLLWGLSLFPVFCAPYIRPSFLEPCRSSLVLLKLLKCWDREHGLKPYSSDLNRFYRRSCSASGEPPYAENIRQRWAAADITFLLRGVSHEIRPACAERFCGPQRELPMPGLT